MNKSKVIIELHTNNINSKKIIVVLQTKFNLFNFLPIFLFKNKLLKIFNKKFIKNILLTNYLLFHLLKIYINYLYQKKS